MMRMITGLLALFSLLTGSIAQAVPVATSPAPAVETSRAMIAMRLLAASDRGPKQGTALTGAVTLGASNTFTSPLTGTDYNSARSFATYAQPVGGVVTGSGTITHTNGGWIFGTDAPRFDFYTGGGRFELWVNGVQTTEGSYAALSNTWNRIEFGTNERRVVELRFNAAVPNINGFSMQKIYSLWPVPPPGPKVMVVSDSLGFATGYGGLNAPGQGYIPKLGRLNNWNVISNGIGGNGYVNESGSTGAFLAQVNNRLPNHLDTDLIIFAGGYNDSAYTATLAAAAKMTWLRARELCPKCLIAVVGPWRGLTDQTSFKNIIKNAYLEIADDRMTFIDNIAEGWDFGGDLKGNGTTESGEITFTGAISSATSATLSTNWTGKTASYTIRFDTGAAKTATLTNGSTAVSWTGALSAGTAAFAYTAASGNSGLYKGDQVHGDTTWHSYMAGRLKDDLDIWLRTLVR